MNILNKKILKKSIEIEILSINKELLGKFFNSLFGIETFFYDLSSPKRVLKHTLVKSKGVNYFDSNSSYIKLHYFYYESTMFHARINPLVNSKKYVIYLEDEDLFFDYLQDEPKKKKNLPFEVLKQSKHLQKCLLLLNNTDSAIHLDPDYILDIKLNNKFIVEKIKISQDFTKNIIDLIKRHFLEDISLNVK